MCQSCFYTEDGSTVWTNFGTETFKDEHKVRIIMDPYHPDPSKYAYDVQEI